MLPATGLRNGKKDFSVEARRVHGIDNSRALARTFVLGVLDVANQVKYLHGINLHLSPCVSHSTAPAEPPRGHSMPCLKEQATTSSMHEVKVTGD